MGKLHRPAPILATTVILSFTLAGCDLYKKIVQPDPGPEPVTRPMLALMPESAGAAFAMPPVNVAGDKFFTVFERVAPEGTDAESVATAFVHFLGHLLHTPEAESLGDIFLANGVSPDEPIGFFLRPQTSGAPSSTAVVATATDPEKIREFMETLASLVGQYGPEKIEEPLGALHPPSNDELVYELDDNRGFFTQVGAQVIFSDSSDFALEIAARVDNPMHVRYGTADCPAESSTEFAGLIRMDRMGGLGTSLIETFAGEEGLADMFGQPSSSDDSAESEEPLFSDDPMVVTLDWSSNDLRFSSRADLAEHDGLRRSLGKPHPLRLAKAAPSNTIGLITLRFSPESKETMMNTFGGLMDVVPGAGDVDFEVGESLAGWTQFVDDELTLAMTGTSADGKPTGVGMLAVRNKTQLSSLIMSMPVPGTPVETYRRVEIRTLPGTQLYSATARNTFIIGNHLDEVKQSVDNLLDGTGDALQAFEPDIDAGTPRYGAVFLQDDAVSSIAASLLDLGIGGVDWFGPMRDSVRDARISADLNGTWLNGRAQLRFDSESPTPAP